MSGRFEELVGVSGIDTGEIIYRDDSIDAATRSLVDLGWVWGGGAQALAIDDRVKNLCWLDDPLIARAALPTAGGGAAFSGDNSYALLPEGFMLRQSDRHMLFTMHLKMSRAAPAGASYNSRIVDFRTGNTSQLSIIPTVDANGAMTNLEIATNSFGWSVMGALSSIVDNKVHQLGVELTVSADEAYNRNARAEAEFEIALGYGRPDYQPELPAALQGFKPQVDARRWIIAELSHTLDGSGGLATKLKLETIAG